MPLQNSDYTSSEGTTAQRTEKSNHHMDNAREAARSARAHIREASHQVGEGVRGARSEARAAVDDVKTAASESSQAALDKGAIYLEKAENLIRERPFTAFGVAFAAGWMISRVFKRS